MDKEKILNAFKMAYPPFILLTGIIGNSFGVRILSVKSLIKFPAKKLYFYLFLIDTICLIQIIENYLESSFNINLKVYSIFSCKFLSYLNYNTANFSPFLLTFIAIDRYVCITYPQYLSVLRRNKTQNIFLIGVASFNLIYYFPAALQFTIEKKRNQL